MARLKRCDLCGAEADELMSIDFPYEERWMLFFHKRSLAHYADLCLDCLEKIRAERQAQIKANEVDFEIADTPQTETQMKTQNSNLTFKTLEYCDICDHKGCEECIANALDEHCMPSQFKKQIEDECAKEYEELGLKELKELIEADRKTEPTISKMEQVDKDINVRSKDEEYINNLPWTEVGNGEQTDDAYFLELMGAVERGEISDAGANQAWYEYINHKDEPQTDCAWK